ERGRRLSPQNWLKAKDGLPKVQAAVKTYVSMIGGVQGGAALKRPPRRAGRQVRAPLVGGLTNGHERAKTDERRRQVAVKPAQQILGGVGEAPARPVTSSTICVAFALTAMPSSGLLVTQRLVSPVACAQDTEVGGPITPRRTRARPCRRCRRSPAGDRQAR